MIIPTETMHVLILQSTLVMLLDYSWTFKQDSK